MIAPHPLLSTRRLSRRKIFPVFTLTLLGCKSELPQCFPELNRGDTILVELTEQSEPAPGSDVKPWEPETCNQDWGVDAGTVLEIQVEGFEGGRACTSAWGSMRGLDQTTLEPSRDIPVDGERLVSGSYLLERGNCAARLDVTIDTDKLPTSSWDGSGDPPGFAWLNFLPDQGSDCPETCLVRFGAEARVE